MGIGSGFSFIKRCTGHAEIIIGGCIDVETTGLSPYVDEVVEFALVLFSCNRKTHEITGVLNEYSGLREPHCAVSRGAFQVHGLSPRILKGKYLDNDKILFLLSQADFLISHNAEFDYNFVIRLFPEFSTKPWYCSMSGIGWRGKGFNSRGLQNLLIGHGIEIAQSHRALDDARAVIALLRKLNEKGKPYLGELLGSRPIAVGTYRSGYIPNIKIQK